MQVEVPARETFTRSTEVKLSRSRLITTLEKLRSRAVELKEICARHGASNVRVFGSVARGDAVEGSDVDLLVDFGPDVSLLDYAGLVLELQDYLGLRVDVASKVKPALRESIMAEAVSL